MAADKTQAWAYAEDVASGTEEFSVTRAGADEIGVTPISPATGRLLRLIAANVQHAVEVGTGSGLSGLYLLTANPNLILTTIDVDSEAQSVAREAFARAGIRPSRSRIINGRSADLLPRLADSSYDLVFLDGAPSETPGDVEEALRILRPGGILAIDRALLGGKVADPARREPDTVAMRNVIRDLTEGDHLTSLVPIGSGLLLVRKNA